MCIQRLSRVNAETTRPPLVPVLDSSRARQNKPREESFAGGNSLCAVAAVGREAWELPRRPPDKRPPLVSDGALAPLRLFLVPLCWQLSVATGHLCLLPPPSSGGSLHPSLAAPSARIQRLAPHPPTLVGHGACPCSRKLNANFSSDSNRQQMYAALALRLSHGQGGPSEGDVDWRGSVVDSRWNGRR